MPGSAIEPYIMSQQIPYCEKCKEERAAQIAAIKAYRASRRKGKPKGDAWDDDEDSDIDEWDGEPGIIKVGFAGVYLAGLGFPWESGVMSFALLSKLELAQHGSSCASVLSFVCHL